MLESKYTLRYPPKYVEDLNEIIDYIVYKLHSPENAILYWKEHTARYPLSHLNLIE